MAFMPRQQDYKIQNNQNKLKKKVEAAHFQLCGSANYRVVLNILSLDRMAEG